MPAYLIVNIRIKDPAAYEVYKAAVPALVRKHGGRYLVRGGSVEVLEGQWQPERLIVFEFPDMASIRAFDSDPEYAPWKALRQRSAESDLIAVEGL